MSQYRREHPRVTKSLSVEVYSPAGISIHATTYNISRTGLQLSCDRGAVNRLFPTGTLQKTDLPEVLVRLTLPIADGDIETVDANCHPVFSRRVAENEFRVGLQFTGFSEQGYETIERFIESTIADS